MTEFVALYRGRTVGEARLVALSAEPEMVRRFFDELLAEPETEEASATLDPKQGRVRTPRLVRGEAE